MLLCDFHIHTLYSDGAQTLDEIVKLYGELGFDCIAITDHACDTGSPLGKMARFLDRTLTPAGFKNYIAHIDRVAAQAWRDYKMLVLPGVEITQNRIQNSRSCHILGIGTREWVDPNLEAVSAARGLRAQGALAIAAHPVFTRKLEKQTFYLWDRREELKKEFDAWEVASGPYLFSEVLNSGLPLLASSDLHHKKQIRSWKTKLDCDLDPAAVLDAVRKQKLEFTFFSGVASEPVPASFGPQVFDISA